MSAAPRPFRESVFPALHRATRDLSIQRKIRLLPTIAGLAMFVILVMTVAFGAMSRRSASRIRDGYYPSVRLSVGLRERLAVMQRRLQDGVIAKDAEPFREADAQLDTLMKELDAARANPIADRAKLEQLRAQIRSYYMLARRTSQRMIAGEVGSIFASLRSMSSQYGVLRRQLESNAASGEAAIGDAFTSSSRLQLATTSAIALVALGAVVFLWLLSLFTEDLLTRTLTDPLREAAHVADRVARGDVTVTIPASVDGEVGRLLRAMEQMVRYLKEMAIAAEAIAAGDVAVRTEPRSDQDVFGVAFRHMTQYLHSMAQVADSVSTGNLAHRVEPRSEADAFGRAFASMIGTLSTAVAELRSAAQAIAAAAAEVASSAQELSQSTAQEAAVVQQATAALDRVHTLVRRNAATSQETEERRRNARHAASHAPDHGAHLRRRRDRDANQPARAQCGDRGRPRRRPRARIRRGRGRGAGACRRESDGGARNPVARGVESHRRPTVE